MSALKRTADAQVSLGERLDRHKCEPGDSTRVGSRENADVLLRQEPDADEEEEDDPPKKDDDDDDESDGGYSE
jgi:hypothetical protein